MKPPALPEVYDSSKKNYRIQDKTMTNELAKQLVRSIKLKGLPKLLSELGEALLDTNSSNEILKAIPVLSAIANICNITKAIRER